MREAVTERTQEQGPRGDPAFELQIADALSMVEPRRALRDLRARGRRFFRGGSGVMAVVADIDHLSAAISHATAPAFLLGAVAGFLSVLVGRMERVMDRNRALQSGGADALDPSLKDAIAKSFARRMQLLSRAIYYAVLSALITAALLIAVFAAALDSATAASWPRCSR